MVLHITKLDGQSLQKTTETNNMSDVSEIVKTDQEASQPMQDEVEDFIMKECFTVLFLTQGLQYFAHVGHLFHQLCNNSFKD